MQFVRTAPNYYSHSRKCTTGSSTSSARLFLLSSSGQCIVRLTPWFLLVPLDYRWHDETGCQRCYWYLPLWLHVLSHAGDICDPPSGSERIKTGGYFRSMSMVLALFLLARMVLRIVPMFLPQLIGQPKSSPPLAAPLWSGMPVSVSFRPRTAEVTRLFPDHFLHSPKGRFTQRSMRGQSV